MLTREEHEKARSVLLYLGERYETVDDKISYFSSFPNEIHRVPAEYSDIFDSKLRKSMKVEPVLLNMVEGCETRACYTCCPTPVHYRQMA